MKTNGQGAVFSSASKNGKKQLAVGIDAGSWRSRCAVLAVDDGALRFLGCGDAPAGGWYRGRVSDQGRVAASIHAAVRAAEADAGVQVESGVLGVGGPTVQGLDSHWAYRFPRPREISYEEMSYAIEQGANLNLESDRMILHVCPQFFTVDGHPGYTDPRGLACSRLEANVHLVTTSTQETQNIVSAMHQAHLSVEETVFEPLAAAYASVLPDERSRGVAVIDIGMQSTDLVIYEGDALVHATSIRISGDHLTRDVACGLGVSYEDAEDLKKDYGCALLGLTGDNSSVVVPAHDGRQAREVSRRDLNRVLDARAEELFVYTAAEIARVGMEKSLLEGVVLTGSAILLNGMLDMAERVLNCQARNGLAVGIKDLPVDVNTPAWTASFGLAMYSARLKLRKESKRKAPGLLELVLR
ncbi:MAG: cell division protein FtsA [Bryobacteraceae bacterium]|nr:cell division protein FtsA [Bryobacteraceae bacterium]